MPATDPSAPPFTSELSEPGQRFLARVIQHALDEGHRTPDDFLKSFAPRDLIESLADADTLRVKLLVATTGTHDKIALKKSLASAAEDLAIALDEGTTDPTTIVSLYPTDDRVRYLPADRLWRFATEDAFWTQSPDDGTVHGRAAERLTFIVQCALDEGLLTLQDVADGMTFETIAASLPPEQREEVVTHALKLGRSGTPLTEEQLITVTPLPSLIGHVPLAHTWQHVVVGKVAAPAGLTEETATNGPAHTAGAGARSPASAEPASGGGQAHTESTRPPEEDDARRRVKERLEGIERLPSSADDLSTPILLSIESMYADLATATTDEEREAAIHDAFPNENHLRTALLALIEHLDPSVDTTEPVIRDAEIQGLIKIVLFEERRRSQLRSSAPPPASSPRQSAPAASSPAPRRTRRSTPPPLPPQSGPPPLPDEPPASPARANKR